MVIVVPAHRRWPVLATGDVALTRTAVGDGRNCPGYGDSDALDLAGKAVPASEHRPVAYATGRAGDVYPCHPFLVHAAQKHHGSGPRFMAQPPLLPAGDDSLVLDRPDGAYSPVKETIRRGLGR